MGFFRPVPKKRDAYSSKVKGISAELILSIREAGKASYPNEFGALLRRSREGIIDELLLLPGTVSGNRHAEFKFYMMHADMNIVGTVHSHPSPYPIPSQEDSILFSKFGTCHIIIAYPYSETSWVAYDRESKTITLKVVDK